MMTMYASRKPKNYPQEMSTPNETLNRPYHMFTSFRGLDYSSPLVVDQICGTILIFCFLFGTTFNCFSLTYFSKLKQKSLAEKLYTLISGCDLCTCIAQSPVIFTLLSRREPYIFASRSFCGAWIIIFEYLHRVSVYLIVLLSVPRTIAIVRPFAVICPQLVLLTLIPYSIALLLDVFIGMIFFEQNFYYIQDFAYPTKGFNKDKTRTPSQHQASFSEVQNLIHDAEVFIPSVFIFLSFLITLIRMQTLPKDTSCNKKIFKASMTVSLATALYLLCNLPFCVLLSLAFYHGNKPNLILTNKAVEPYIWPVAKIVLTVVNATVNPVLYYFRINKFRVWVKGVFSCKESQNALPPATYDSPALTAAANHFKLHSTPLLPRKDMCRKVGSDPYLQTNASSPSSAPRTPGLASCTPGLTPRTPGLTPQTPGLTPRTPRISPRSPGIYSRSPCLTPRQKARTVMPHRFKKNDEDKPDIGPRKLTVG